MRRHLMLLLLVLVLAAPTLPAEEQNDRGNEPELIRVTVGASKGNPGYYYGRCGEFEYITVYSPKLDLQDGDKFDALWTEKKTYRTTLKDNYVWVYVND
ncbi:MAG: hypothetical protein HY319_10165 [Armatimonadetes bacterium]|nr:hypothetical protein [Armatimonadota bacterium]